jgi:hypothetical protein
MSNVNERDKGSREAVKEQIRPVTVCRVGSYEVMKACDIQPRTPSAVVVTRNGIATPLGSRVTPTVCRVGNTRPKKQGALIAGERQEPL